MTIVVDTNVVASAAFWPKSDGRRCFVLMAGVRRWPKLGIVLAIHSIAITTMATLTEATPDYRHFL